MGLRIQLYAAPDSYEKTIILFIFKKPYIVIMTDRMIKLMLAVNLMRKAVVAKWLDRNIKMEINKTKKKFLTVHSGVILIHLKNLT